MRLSNVLKGWNAGDALRAWWMERTRRMRGPEQPMFRISPATDGSADDRWVTLCTLVANIPHVGLTTALFGATPCWGTRCGDCYRCWGINLRLAKLLAANARETIKNRLDDWQMRELGTRQGRRAWR